MNDINQAETTHTSRKKGNQWIFWVLAALALGIFAYFVFGTDKISNPNTDDIVIPNGTTVEIEGLPTDDTTEAAVVNGEVVTQGDVNQLINSELINRQTNFADLSAEEQATLKTQSLDLMVEYTLLLQAAKASGVTVATDAQKQIADVKASFSDEEFAAQLAQLKVTEEQLMETLTNGQLIDTYLKEVVLKGVEATEAEIAAETAATVEQSGGQEALDAQLATYNMTKDDFAAAMKDAAKMKKEQALVQAKIDELRAAATIELR